MIHHFFSADIAEFSSEELWTKEWLRQAIIEIVEKRAAAKAEYPEDVLRNMERSVMLRLIDKQWKEHLLNLDMLAEL